MRRFTPVCAVAAIVLPISFSFGDVMPFVELTITQRTIGNSATREVFGDLNVDMQGVANVDSVDFDMGGGWNPLQFDGAYWARSESTLSLADFVANQMSSNWQLRVNYTSVSGGGSSVYGFTVATANLTEQRFLGLPLITSPTHGGQGVPAGATITWDAPAGASSEHLIIAEREEYPTYTNYRMEILNVPTTSWTPGDISILGDQISIQYAARDAMNTASALTYVSGNTIDWGKSPYSDPGALDGVPLLAYVSGNQITVNYVPEPTSLVLLATAGLLLARRKR